MADVKSPFLNRRLFLGGTAAAVAMPAFAQNDADTTEFRDRVGAVRRNASSFRALDWQPYFDNTRNGAILVDLSSRALHYWGPDQTTYKLFPTSVPLSEDLTRRGRTKVVRKVEGPEWRPTPAMKKRNPDWPDYVGPGPDNPLGARALYLYSGGRDTLYRIHGTNEPWTIGLNVSSGCIRLKNEDIKHLYRHARVGAKVIVR